MIGIYKIISPSNKIYIGQAIDIKKRWNQYKNLEHFSMGTKIYNSLSKYSYDQHKFEILQECKLEELNKLETHWKQYYLYINNWNWNKVLYHELYDNGGGPKSTETKQKMSITHQNYLVKPEILAKRLINCKKSSTLSSKIKRNQNINWVERNKKLEKPKLFYDKIEKFDLDGKSIKVYTNINEILLEFNNPRPQNLYACLKGKYKTWMGFKWKGYTDC